MLQDLRLRLIATVQPEVAVVLLRDQIDHRIPVGLRTQIPIVYDDRLRELRTLIPEEAVSLTEIVDPVLQASLLAEVVVEDPHFQVEVVEDLLVEVRHLEVEAEDAVSQELEGIFA